MCAGVTHVGGDMFKSIPSADAIFMKVSHFFSDHSLTCSSVPVIKWQIFFFLDSVFIILSFRDNLVLLIAGEGRG